MWDYQRSFRLGVTNTLKFVLKEIGFESDPVVLLVGFKATQSSTFDAKNYSICVEPERGRFAGLDLSSVVPDGEARLAASSERKQVEWHYADKGREPRKGRLEGIADQCRGDALAAALSDSEPGQHLTFFGGHSVQVGEYEVHVVVGVETDAFESVARMRTVPTGPKDHAPHDASLVHAVIFEVLDRATDSLLIRDVGKTSGLLFSEGTASPISADVMEIVRTSTDRFLRNAISCRQSDLSAVSLLPYERRWVAGRIVFVEHQALDSTEFERYVEILVRLTRPIARNCSGRLSSV